MLAELTYGSFVLFFLIVPRPRGSTRTDTRFPDTTLCRSTRPVVLAEVLDDTLDFLRPRLERAGATVSVDQPDRSLTVRAGNVRLQHVILNLVSDRKSTRLNSSH